MNQITTQYVTENGACYEQYVITDPAAKTSLTITPERGGMITGFTLDGDEYIWTRRPNFSECNRPRFGVPVLFPSCGNPDGGVHNFDGKAYPMETHGFADLCAWDVESVGPDGVTLAVIFCWNIKETSGFFRSFLFYTRTGAYFAVLMKLRLSHRYLMPEMAVTAATTQHSTEAMSAHCWPSTLPVRETVK